MHSEVFLYWLFQFLNRPFSSTTETNFMKKFNFAALLPGFWRSIILYGQVIHPPEQVICLV